MLKDVIEVRPLDGYRLYVQFEDGDEGIVDVLVHEETLGRGADLAAVPQG